MLSGILGQAVNNANVKAALAGVFGPDASTKYVGWVQNLLKSGAVTSTLGKLGPVCHFQHNFAFTASWHVIPNSRLPTDRICTVLYVYSSGCASLGLIASNNAIAWLVVQVIVAEGKGRVNRGSRAKASGFQIVLSSAGR
jgi:hypothetical protein